MRAYLRHRYAIVLPFVALALVLVVGGLLNGVEARGTVLDAATGSPIPEADVIAGSRRTKTGPDGSYALEHVARNTTLRVGALGYDQQRAPANGGEVRLNAAALQVRVESSTETPQPIVGAEVRIGDRLLTRTGAGGIAVIAPHPGNDAQLLVCARGHLTKPDIPARGTDVLVRILPDPAGDCPLLPTPSPSPASPSPSPRTPSPSPTRP